ncbi:protein phosphatase Slingshot homolog 2 isoform X2 [Monodelphis domestica]|uniref:protein phosphatase Slingshot homolog 2 isoform X2 n=1 Tax=Monodelphis domestica TaxID=13616 RepID=UPI0024E23AEF|nr:protein phosphatase Slingshot homolog 2 isoform X2 [Monodelphis domestica]
MALVTVQRSPTPSTTSSPCASSSHLEDSESAILCCECEESEIFTDFNEADSGEEECRSQPRSISESFLTVKGAALFLPRGNGSSTPRISHRRNKHAGDLQQHLQAMFILLRPEDNIRLAVRLESTYQNRTRYMVVVSTNGRQDTEESIVLGMDFSSNDSTCTMGLVLPLWSDTLIHLDGDGGFSVSTDNRVHIFKPVSVQAMWSALQSLHKACEVARSHNYYPGSLFLTWVSYYESHINSDQSSVNEWNAMRDVQSHRPDSPALFTDIPTERERTERLIKTKLREIMMQKDLENITSKEIRTELEMQMACNLREFKEFIDNEMIVILGQMDSPTQIFEHVFLGSEWNASNLEDLQNRGVRYILNVTREIDNFFPGVFEYHNIRVYDEEATDLLAYWNDTYKFISKAKKHGSKCLVHCKMGVSRSASTVIAYAMKEYGWNLDRAYDYVKERRTVTKPNPSFMRQLEEYQGILLASKQRHNKLWRSHSDSDLSDHHEPICTTGMEFNRKEITTSADQITEAKAMESHPPMPPVFVEHRVPQDASTHELDPKDRMICLEFASREFHTGQIEDELNLNNINGCAAGCCLSESKFPLDNCHASEALIQPEHSLEIAPRFPDLTVEDLETDALKADVSVHLLPMEELTFRLRDLPVSPDPDSPGRPPNSQPEASDFSTDRIDFFSALEKFVELSQETRPRSCSHSRSEEAGGGRNGGIRLSVLETAPCEASPEGQRSSSSSNTPHVSGDSSLDEDQPKDTSELVSPEGMMQSHSENAISVKEIITEIESINQGIGQCQPKVDSVASSCHTPKRNTIHELPLFEATWTAESKPGNLDQREGVCAVQPDLAKGDQEAMLVAPTPLEDVEEGDLTEEDAECRGPGTSPAPKWCPGSVRRATLEFEERLRQEQEHHSAAPLSTLPARKNSRNDAALPDGTPRGKNEEAAPEPAAGPKELELSKTKTKEGGGLEAFPPQPEQEADPQAPALLGFHPSPAFPERPLDFGAKAERVSKEPPTSKTKPILEHLPKRIEIIEYTPMVTSPDLTFDLATAEKNGEPVLKTVMVEKSIAVMCAVDENLNTTLCPELASLHPQVLPLLRPASLQHDAAPQTAFTPDSPEDEDSRPPSPPGTAPLGSPAAHFPSASLDCLHPQTVLHLEGVTQESSTTDREPWSEPSSIQGLPRGSDSPQAPWGADPPRVLSPLGESTRDVPETLAPPAPHRLSHSSSSDSISVSHRVRVAKKHSKEIESRILRQAGLTRPSQMKRSASLARLDHLNLHSGGFPEVELVSLEAPHPGLQPVVRTARGASGLHEPSEGPGPLSQPPEPTTYFVEPLKMEECLAQSKPVERPLVQYAKEFGSAAQCLLPQPGHELTSSGEGLPSLQIQQGLDSPGPGPGRTVAAPQQPGRTHPLRRLRKPNDRKRTSNPFYHTM